MATATDERMGIELCADLARLTRRTQHSLTVREEASSRLLTVTVEMFPNSQTVLRHSHGVLSWT